MQVFVTGASGFVGSAIVNDLLAAGHKVLGLVRSDKGAEKVAAAGAEALLGDVNDPEILRRGATSCDAVIHTAFNHDFSRFKQNCEDDRVVIGILADALAGTDKPLVVTSGVGLLNYGRPATEDDAAPSSDVIPRAASEEATKAAAAKGVDAYIVRLPPSTHGAGDHGFVPMIVDMAKEKGESAYIGEGKNLWPATHRNDAAAIYRLAIEKRPALKVFHAAAETGVPFKQIAETIGEGSNLPVVSKTSDEIAAHFTWFAHFAAMDCQSSAEKTKAALGWEPKELGLIDDMKANYFN